MAFKMKGFPMHKGISPMRMSKDDPSNNDPYSQTQANSALYGGEESGDKDANTNVENDNTNNAGFNDTKTDLDNDTNTDKKKKEAETKEAANATPKYDKEGNIIDGSETASASDIGKFMNKPILDVLGLSKKAREKRKAKRTEKVKNAREAEGKGEETYKQAKTINRANKRDAKKAKKKVEDTKKRDEYKANLKTKKAAKLAQE